jgi:hypothetical protein
MRLTGMEMGEIQSYTLKGIEISEKHSLGESKILLESEEKKEHLSQKSLSLKERSFKTLSILGIIKTPKILIIHPRFSESRDVPFGLFCS